MPEDRPLPQDVPLVEAAADAQPSIEDASADAIVTTDAVDVAVPSDAGPGDAPGADRELPADAPDRTDARPDAAVPDVAPPDSGTVLPRDPVERARYCATLTGCLDCMHVRFPDDTGCAWCSTGLRSGRCQYGTPVGPSSVAGICEATSLRWWWRQSLRRRWPLRGRAQRRRLWWRWWLRPLSLKDRASTPRFCCENSKA